MTDYSVEFVGTGETIAVADTQTILRACLDEGIPQEYSCRVGMCLACCAEIVQGEVVQPAAHALSAGLIIGLVYGFTFFTLGMPLSAIGAGATGLLWSLIAALRSPDSSESDDGFRSDGQGSTS
jgi:hypothetical protein